MMRLGGFGDRAAERLKLFAKPRPATILGREGGQDAAGR
jgi:hypothetical protein